ncbi:MAG: hypothetical protein B6D58_09445, partial [candidate division Zixibacteria bacterium 4484_95]
MDIFSELRKAIKQSGRHVVAAKVVATDPVLMTADVIFESEKVIREAVPLRIFSDDDNGLGVAWIPKVNSEVLVTFIDGAESRPQIIKVQQWEYIIARKGAGDSLLEFVIDNENKVSLKRGEDLQFTIDGNTQLDFKKGPIDNPILEITIDPNEQVDLRKKSGFQFTIDSQDKVFIGNAPSHKLAWGDIWLQKFNTHTHPTPTGPSGPPFEQLQDIDVNSQIFKV